MKMTKSTTIAALVIFMFAGLFGNMGAAQAREPHRDMLLYPVTTPQDGVGLLLKKVKSTGKNKGKAPVVKEVYNLKRSKKLNKGTVRYWLTRNKYQQTTKVVVKFNAKWGGKTRIVLKHIGNEYLGSDYRITKWMTAKYGRIYESVGIYK